MIFIKFRKIPILLVLVLIVMVWGHTIVSINNFSNDGILIPVELNDEKYITELSLLDEYIDISRVPENEYIIIDDAIYIDNNSENYSISESLKDKYGYMGVNEAFFFFDKDVALRTLKLLGFEHLLVFIIFNLKLWSWVLWNIDGN